MALVRWAMTVMGRGCMRPAAAIPVWSPSLPAFRSVPAAPHPSPHAIRHHCDEAVPANARKVNLSFVDKDGKQTPVVAKEGQNLVGVAHEHGVDLEGACECSLACSTCHVILEPRVYDGLDPPKDEENDLLDLAFGLTATSRLGCQVKVTPQFEGAKIQLPAATRNFYVDGHKPKPH